MKEGKAPPLRTGTEWDSILDYELSIFNNDEQYEAVRVNNNTVRFQKRELQEKNKMDESKNIFKSKTFWANFAVGAGLMFTEYTNTQLPVGNDTIAIALAAANVFLRGFTNKPVTVLPKDKSGY